MEKQTATGTAKRGAAPGRTTRKLEPKPSGFAKWEKLGDKVAGIVTAKEDMEGKYGTRTVATVEPDGGGEIKVDMGLAGLRDYVEEIEVGNWYSITYVADKTTPNGIMKCFGVEDDNVSEAPENDEQPDDQGDVESPFTKAAK